MKVDHQAGSGGPASTIWTTLTTNNVCYGSYVFSNVANDFADVTKSYLILTTPKTTSTDCAGLGADNRPAAGYLALRMDMDATSAPLSVPNPLAVIRTGSGAISGFIVRNGDRIQRVDANFTNATDLFAAPIGIISIGVFGATAPGIWVYSDSQDLYAVDLANPTSATALNVGLSSALILPDNTVIADGSMYVAFNAKLVRINSDRTATQLGTASASISELSATTSRLIFKTASTLGSISKTGGTAQTIANLSSAALDLYVGIKRMGAIDPSTGSSSLWQRSFLIGGENVYYGTTNGNAPNVYNVYVVSSDGSSAQTISGARIASWAEAASVPWIGNTAADTLYIAENESTGLFAGASLHAVNAATRGDRFTVGNFPSPLILQLFNFPVDPLQFGQPGLITAMTTSLSGSIAYNLFSFRSDTVGLNQATQY